MSTRRKEEKIPKFQKIPTSLSHILSGFWVRLKFPSDLSKVGRKSWRSLKNERSDNTILGRDFRRFFWLPTAMRCRAGSQPPASRPRRSQPPAARPRRSQPPRVPPQALLVWCREPWPSNFTTKKNPEFKATGRPHRVVTLLRFDSVIHRIHRRNPKA